MTCLLQELHTEHAVGGAPARENQTMKIARNARVRAEGKLDEVDFMLSLAAHEADWSTTAQNKTTMPRLGRGRKR